mgnify:FL=1
MTRSEVYDALRAWLQQHGFDTDYRVQKRFFTEHEDSQNERYLIIQQNGGGGDEQAISRDYFRIILLTGQNDPGIDAVENNADAIRRAMSLEYQTECIILMQPVGGVPAFRTEEGRVAFEINFRTIISQ